MRVLTMLGHKVLLKPSERNEILVMDFFLVGICQGTMGHGKIGHLTRSNGETLIIT